jgi:DNA-binding CsgD family transcriptional regulator
VLNEKGKTNISLVECATCLHTRNLSMKKKPTKTELEVLRLMLEGKSSREISNLCNRKIKSIDFHRWNIFKKMGVTNLSDFFKRAAKMRL